ncbi:ARM REPEAT PROTEIN INTERACTING WITH ABF2-like [Papaver somniferum]|uniref:ARM REPEAT PROTEIN INTERACTING WITH ABF2-like n=1 Tax=Papaver somniferum TaxID=3469 RepID=UPI000E6F75F5|nr:ARM REPEAT PROTEIN INTERACTING WITH ABF2-like [Papaver somniferum]
MKNNSEMKEKVEENRCRKPNLRFHLLLEGSVDVTLDMAQDLIGAADQYLLAGLKRLCEYAIAQDVTLEMSQPCTSYRRTSIHAHLIQFSLLWM